MSAHRAWPQLQGPEHTDKVREVVQGGLGGRVARLVERLHVVAQLTDCVRRGLAGQVKGILHRQMPVVVPVSGQFGPSRASAQRPVLGSERI